MNKTQKVSDQNHKMSIISGPAIKVSNVQILVGRIFPAKVIERIDKTTKQLKRFKVPDGPPMQLTVLSNYIEKESSREVVSLILPFPMQQKSRRFKILNLQSYEEIFSDFSQFFNSKPLDNGDGVNWDTWNDDEDIKEYHNDKYETQVIASFSVLARYQQQLCLSDALLTSIKQYYSHGYGFIICAAGRSAKFYPLAYIHELMPGDKLFVPTRHLHGHGRASQFDSHTTTSRFEETGEELTEHMQQVLLIEDKYINHKLKRATIASHATQIKNDWDHTIFVVNHDIGANTMFANHSINLEPGKQNMIDKYKNFIKIANLPKEITFNGIVSVFKISVRPTYKINHDIIL
jgi:hypothetical protein